MQYLTDPYERLKEYCLEHDLRLIDMDIFVRDVRTKVTYANLKTEELSRKDLEQFDIDEVFVDATKFEQSFAVEFVRKSEINFDFRLAADKDLMRTAAVFYAEQCDLSLPDEKLIEEIKQKIARKLIKARLLVGVREAFNDAKIIEVLERLRSGAHKATLNLAQGVPAVEGNPPKVIEHYKARTNSEQFGQRGFMHPARVDDLVVEYLFATPNRDGRNLAGAALKSELVRANREVPFSVDDSLREDRQPESVRYYAQKPGFVEYIAHKGQYSIKDELSISAASFKDTGSIDGGGKDTNVTLRINEMDGLKDAVGANVTLDVAKIKVEGSVAQNAVIKAVEVQIGGQTHQKSKIIATQISIAQHRGYAKGDLVEVKHLEGGVIEGKRVKVQNAIGGRIIAEEIEIENAIGNTLCELTKSAKIINCKGQNNRFYISLHKDEKFRKTIEQIEANTAGRAKTLEELPARVAAKKSLIEKNRDNIASIQGKLKEYTASGRPAPAAFVLKIKEFKALVEEFSALKSELQNAQDEQARDDEKLSSMQEEIFNTKVECLSPWNDACEVRFDLLNPHKSVSFISSKGEQANLIYLVREGDEVLIKKEKYDSND